MSHRAPHLTHEVHARIVPVCQREGCNKPLHSMHDRRYFWTRENRTAPPVQVVFCAACFAALSQK